MLETRTVESRRSNRRSRFINNIRHYTYNDTGTIMPGMLSAGRSREQKTLPHLPCAAAASDSVIKLLVEKASGLGIMRPFPLHSCSIVSILKSDRRRPRSRSSTPRVPASTGTNVRRVKRLGRFTMAGPSHASHQHQASHQVRSIDFKSRMVSVVGKQGRKRRPVNIILFNEFSAAVRVRYNVRILVKTHRRDSTTALTSSSAAAASTQADPSVFRSRGKSHARIVPPPQVAWSGQSATSTPSLQTAGLASRSLLY